MRIRVLFLATLLVTLAPAAGTRAAEAEAAADVRQASLFPRPAALEPQLTIPPGAQSITIAPDGTVSYSVPGQTAAQNGGQIQLATFQNAAGLNSLGRNLYSPTDASGDPTVGNPGGQEGMGPLLQGYTEQSNVSVVDSFVQLIMSQRAYEANSRVVRAADEMYQKINTMTS